MEEKGGWVRTTKYYKASCHDGINRYVDKGNNECTPSNGVTDGLFAEWVSAKYLNKTRPADPAAGATGNYSLVKSSDDYRIYKDVFARVASELIASGRCSAGDFKEMGGWVKSSNHRDKPIYFTYCGGLRLSNKIYLNASTGKIVR